MQIEIFDVEHGACALVTADNGARILFDCGHNSTTDWRPSEMLRARGITRVENLVVANYDEDHVSDLPNVLSQVYVPVLTRNPSVAPLDLFNLKSESGVGNGIGTLAVMAGTHYTAPVTVPQDFGAIRLQHFWNRYPQFTEENDLSLVTILNYHNHGVIFPGDLQTAGWQRLLQNPNFLAALSTVNIFVASHHGRIDGYCPEVFDYCNPEIIIFSDKQIDHETQLTAGLYRDHARGIRFFDGQTRYVLTTRNNGYIRFAVQGPGMGFVWISKR